MRVLTKSRFKLGLECPNKLFYTGKKEFVNTNARDPILKALATEGFQVEELSRLLIPNGHLITGDDYKYKELWDKTKDLMTQDNVVIYEGAILADALFIRADIIEKKGNSIDLIEVKAKSYNPDNEHEFIGSQGALVSSWKPYLFDLAFQKYVLQLKFPNHKIKAYLMLADKSKMASINGLNQLFRVQNTATHRTGIEVLAKNKSAIGNPVVEKVDVTKIIEGIITDKYLYRKGSSFLDSINALKEVYVADTYADWSTAYTPCKNCEFKTTPEEKALGLKSGYEYCFNKKHNWNDNDFSEAAIIDIKDLHPSRGKKYFENKQFFMKDLSRDDLGIDKSEIDIESDEGAYETKERNWLQIKTTLEKTSDILSKKEGLKDEIKTWKFPLHFIDFETSAAALPYHSGRKPYEQIAFQYSHHLVKEDGSIEHNSEYLNTLAGKFPNFDFVRSLKKDLEKDQGSIFRYADHENSILIAIHRQLELSDEPDKEDLMDFIESMTTKKNRSKVVWTGERDMVDLLRVVKKYYYNPLTHGSNSIKDVLPAVLATSEFLKDKYAKSIGEIGLSSQNFPDSHRWLKIKDGGVQSPYKRLPPVFEGWTFEEKEKTLSGFESLADGGAALTAYAKLQYKGMTKEETDKINKALLRYCELDTLAMVMIYEHFLELI